MEFELEFAMPEDKSGLCQILEIQAHDDSEFNGEDVDEH